MLNAGMTVLPDGTRGVSSSILLYFKDCSVDPPWFPFKKMGGGI
jgi:hypothetical protein